MKSTCSQMEKKKVWFLLWSSLSLSLSFSLISKSVELKYRAVKPMIGLNFSKVSPNNNDQNPA
jgi:hypothetical protein